MRVRLLASSVSGAKQQYLMTYLINNRIAIDAGCLGFWETPEDQSRIKHVLLSHSHADHIVSLPMFIENVYKGTPDCVVIHGGESVLECLKQDVFNDRVWPDFFRLSPKKAPFLKLQTIQSGKSFFLDGVRVTPIDVDHAVPTLGFVLSDSHGAVVIPSDTGPTDKIWETAARVANLKAVFLEATFPNALDWLAVASKHLTPVKFAAEIQKLGKRLASIDVIAVHLKAVFQDAVAFELGELGIRNLQIGEPGREYVFE